MRRFDDTHSEPVWERPSAFPNFKIRGLYLLAKVEVNPGENSCYPRRKTGVLFPAVLGKEFHGS